MEVLQDTTRRTTLLKGVFKFTEIMIGDFRFNHHDYMSPWNLLKKEKTEEENPRKLKGKNKRLHRRDRRMVEGRRGSIS
uniref:Uncharacterized protein n=1 Tax=Medicago truncatula TaxID=3880 RepID=Q2HTK2_MEDTR|nr:hypothetical protein MtrDRAFT_AC150440g9v2 [Medicago truncatula]